MTTPTHTDTLRAAMDIGEERAAAIGTSAARKLFCGALLVRAVFAAGRAHKPGNPGATARVGAQQIASDTTEFLFGGIGERARKYSRDR
jgi:hypothetical protein